MIHQRLHSRSYRIHRHSACWLAWGSVLVWWWVRCVGRWCKPRRPRRLPSEIEKRFCYNVCHLYILPDVAITMFRQNRKDSQIPEIHVKLLLKSSIGKYAGPNLAPCSTPVEIYSEWKHFLVAMLETQYLKPLIKQLLIRNLKLDYYLRKAWHCIFN